VKTAKYVNEQIQIRKQSGMPLSDAIWETALDCIGWPYVFGAWGEECNPSKRGRRVSSAHPKTKAKCQVLNGKKSTCDGCPWFPGGECVLMNDCRGFTGSILEQFGINISKTGCTSQWNGDYWEAKGEIKDGIPDDVLVCLFHPDSEDPKKMAHTGFGYHGSSCECQVGVEYYEKRKSKWTHWAIPKGIGGDVPVIRPTLRKGSTGPAVVECQEDLLKLGYDLSPYGADGKYGNKTAAAVTQFQKDHPPLVPDGICGPLTWAELDEAVKPQPDPGPSEILYTVTIEHLDRTQAKALCNAYPTASMKEEGSGV
jgi:hypothetical protein